MLKYTPRFYPHICLWGDDTIHKNNRHTPHPRTRYITVTALFAALIAISAQIRIPLGPVPLTAQSMAVLITGYVLGSKYGMFSTLLYTAVGLAGVPVFTSGGGPAYIMSPTFGYIIGFTLCAMITGWLASLVHDGKSWKAYLVMLAGLSGIYIPGIAWLIVYFRFFAPVSSDITTILKIGFIIPVNGDLLTAIPAAILAVKIRQRMFPT